MCGIFGYVGRETSAADIVFLLAGRRNVANFIGLWVPTILIMGLYNKLVKLEGSES